MMIDKSDAARRSMLITKTQIHLRKRVIKYFMIIFDRAMHQIVVRNVFRAKQEGREKGIEERRANRRE